MGWMRAEDDGRESPGGVKYENERERQSRHLALALHPPIYRNIYAPHLMEEVEGELRANRWRKI